MAYVAEAGRDYSLVGASTQRAIETGLASAEWYHSDVPRKTMKELMQRSDGPAIRDTILWIALLVCPAAGGIYFWGSWLCVPFFLVYGVIYGSACDSRWHECGHGTAFKTRWMNDVVYQIASFQVMRNPVTWRWSHARHHTDTIIVGRDAEIAIMRPPALLKTAGALCRRARRLSFHEGADPQCDGDAVAGREELHPRNRATEGDLRRARAYRHLRGDDPRRARDALLAAADADRPAASLWLLAHGDGRVAAARRPRRQRARPPAQLAHRLHEPDQPVHLLEHELSRRTPHVPDGALPRAAAAA